VVCVYGVWGEEGTLMLRIWIIKLKLRKIKLEKLCIRFRQSRILLRRRLLDWIDDMVRDDVITKRIALYLMMFIASGETRREIWWFLRSRNS